MAKILSGGYAYEDKFLPNKQTEIIPAETEKVATTSEMPTQEEQPESWGAYGLRNVTKIPALAYETARSGLGIGDLAKKIVQSPVL